MADSLGADSISSSDSTNQIRQAVDQNQGQVIAQMVGGLAVGQLTVYLSHIPTQTAIPTQTTESAKSLEFGDNPYQGLLTFRETDGDRFFGRSTQIEQLWQRFQQLHGDRSTIRILPIYGPSGSGKSSLARAGLIPALGKQPLPGCKHSRVVVLTPGNRPLEALATVLARIATHDPMPVAKTREFKEELLHVNSQKEFDGLRRIANAFPDIEFSPLIVLVDQFEEIYTLCTDATERDAFVQNLLCAASDRAQRVSIILTMRSDFLGATQQHLQLNKLFSTQGFLVPIMQPEELAIAITEPAKQAGYTLDKAIVQWLIEETQDRESALPLLQFALTQIWEGLQNGVDPADTLRKIGGVGGALANEAKRIYSSLNSEQQQAAQSIFLALVQVNEDNRNTRRRAAISELITSNSSEVLVRNVIDHFARPGVWILVTFCNEQQLEMLEVAHEALIRNWKELQEWLKEHWSILRQKRKLEEAASEWADQNRHKDYLLQGLRLQNTEELLKEADRDSILSNLAREFVSLSIKRQRNSRLKTNLLIKLPLAISFTIILLIFPVLLLVRANDVLFSTSNDCAPNLNAKQLLQFMIFLGFKNRLQDINLCNQDLRGINLSGVRISRPNFEIANLANSSFHEATLTNSSFRGATLASADFSNAFLAQADFRCLESNCTFLIGANFQSANLTKTQFQGAILEKANFERANLTDANLEGAKELTVEQLANATLCNTSLPNYLINIPRDRDCP